MTEKPKAVVMPEDRICTCGHEQSLHTDEGRCDAIYCKGCGEFKQDFSRIDEGRKIYFAKELDAWLKERDVKLSHEVRELAVSWNGVSGETQKRFMVWMLEESGVFSKNYDSKTINWVNCWLGWRTTYFVESRLNALGLYDPLDELIVSDEEAEKHRALRGGK